MPTVQPISRARRLLAYLRHPAWIPRRLAWEMQSRVRPRVTIVTRYGTFAIRARNRAIGIQLATRREFEADVMRTVVELLHTLGHPLAGRTVLDVGANIGMSCIGFLLAGHAGRAIAIEPDPTNFADLTEHVAQNGLADRIRCERFAAADHEGIVRLDLSEDNFGDHRVGAADASGTHRSVSVPALRVDTFVARLTPAERSELALLWMDVQGYDQPVLTGAEALVRSGVPVCTECWPYGIVRAGLDRATYCATITRLFRTLYVIGNARETARPAALPAAAIADVYDRLDGTTDDRTILLVP